MVVFTNSDMELRNVWSLKFADPLYQADPQNFGFEVLQDE